MDTELLRRVLDAELPYNDISPSEECRTVRDYLHALLAELWELGGEFDGKRPFGYAGWRYPLYAALIKGNLIDGTLDSDGFVNHVTIEEIDKARKLISDAIAYTFNHITNSCCNNTGFPSTSTVYCSNPHCRAWAEQELQRALSRPDQTAI